MSRLGTAIRCSPVAPALGLARRLARGLLASTPMRAVGSPLLARHQGLGACLVYHRVHANAGAGAANWGNAGLSVAVEDFDRQIEWLARHRRCLALDEAIELLESGRLPAGAALVTFDDGYRDNLEHALPVLERHGVPAAIFVTTGLIDAATDPWWQELEDLLRSLGAVEVEIDGARRRFPLRSTAQRSFAFGRLAEWGRSAPPGDVAGLLERIRAQAGLARSVAGPAPRPTAGAAVRPAARTPPAANPMLTWDEVGRLARHPLITIGGHTLSHPPLRALPEAEARREIADSGRVLAERTGMAVRHFAYPFGGRAQVGRRESELVAAAGYRSAFTTLEGHLHAEHAGHRFLLPRFAITRRDGIAGLRFKLSGWEALLRNRSQGLVTI